MCSNAHMTGKVTTYVYVLYIYAFVYYRYRPRHFLAYIMMSEMAMATSTAKDKTPAKENVVEKSK